MRKAPQPDIIIPTLKLRADDNLIIQEREYELITPLYGGGVEPGEYDKLTPIRGSGVRGHLRFWWRATQAGSLSFNRDLRRVKEAEDMLWGSTSTQSRPTPSQIKVAIRITGVGVERHPFEVKEKKDRRTGKTETYPDGTPKAQLLPHTDVAPSYAAFPLQPTQKEMKPKWKSKPVLERVRFVVRISYPRGVADNTKKSVEAALWAWETFGGVGARTRRGFGAIQLIGVGSVPQSPVFPGDDLGALCSEIRRQLGVHVIPEGQWPDDIPHLTREPAFEITEFQPTAQKAWELVIDKLREFRQQRNPGGQHNRPGRSKWPEPEAVRQITGQRLSEKVRGKPSKQIHQPIEPRFVKFPRAVFGLPIIFHFKNPKGRHPFDADSDPRKTVLRPEGSERLASPLILRPIAVGKKRFVGLALILEGTGEPDSLKLALYSDEDKDKSLLRDGLTAELDQNQADQIKKSDGQRMLLNGRKDVLDGFLDYLISEEAEDS